MNRRLLLLFGMLVTAVVLTMRNAEAQESYSSAAITGKVVDAETGEPLANVNIVAVWEIDPKWVGYDNALLKVMETVSDAEGNYCFPAWGPISLPALANFEKGEDPWISYFKSGYWPAKANNDIVSDIKYRTPPLGQFKWNGKAIKLRKWDGANLREYESRLSGLASDMPVFYGANWKDFPRMTLEIEKAGRLVQQQGKFWWGAVHVRGFDVDSLSKEDMEFVRSLANEK